MLLAIGIILFLIFIGARQVLQAQENAAFIRTLQGLFWQGTTEAAARGQTLVLVRQGNRLLVQNGNTVLKEAVIPAGVSLSLGDGVVAQFTPPGKLRNAQGQDLYAPFTFGAQMGGRSYTFTVSLIGEVKVE